MLQSVALVYYICVGFLFGTPHVHDDPIIRLSEELKARVAEAAKRAGTTSHSFILETIADKRA